MEFCIDLNVEFMNNLCTVLHKLTECDTSREDVIEETRSPPGVSCFASVSAAKT
jgi:hypothetical protein